MKLEDICGEHVLTCVDFGTRPPKSDDYYNDNSQTVTFVLDSIAYTAVEDPEDGYRSCLGEIFIDVYYKGVNTFEPVDVICSIKTERKWYASDVECYILSVNDKITGKPILEVGTDNTDDYYPSFVSAFMPENMIHNISTSIEEKMKVVKEFIEDITSFGGKYAYLNGTPIVGDAIKILKILEE